MSSKVVFPFWLVSGEMMGAFFAGKSELCCIFNVEANNLAPPHLHQHTKKMKKLIKCRFWEICLLKNLLLCQILNNYPAFSIYPIGNHQFIHEQWTLSSLILYFILSIINDIISWSSFHNILRALGWSQSQIDLVNRSWNMSGICLTM